jgi:hypothetical protein
MHAGVYGGVVPSLTQAGISLAFLPFGSLGALVAVAFLVFSCLAVSQVTGVGPPTVTPQSINQTMHVKHCCMAFDSGCMCQVNAVFHCKGPAFRLMHGYSQVRTMVYTRYLSPIQRLPRESRDPASRRSENDYLGLVGTNAQPQRCTKLCCCREQLLQRCCRVSFSAF